MTFFVLHSYLESSVLHFTFVCMYVWYTNYNLHISPYTQSGWIAWQFRGKFSMSHQFMEIELDYLLVNVVHFLRRPRAIKFLATGLNQAEASVTKIFCIFYETAFRKRCLNRQSLSVSWAYIYLNLYLTKSVLLS